MVGIRLEAVFAGRVGAIEKPGGRIGKSGIAKRPIEGTARFVASGIAGDESNYYSRDEGDTAIHLYPAEHYDRIAELAGRAIERPSFGENLSTTGYLESEMRIGDELRIGPVLLRVTQPVIRCKQPGILAGEPRLLKWANADCLIGSFLSVVEPGEVAIPSEITLERRGDAAWTVSRLHYLWLAGKDTEEAREALALPGLSDKWKDGLKGRFSAEA
jgi:MOSC domain-containing protein YiiM